MGQSAQRDLSRGTPGILDLADDTDNSAVDFIPAPPMPKTNKGTTRTTPGFGSNPVPGTVAAPGPISFGSIVVGSTLPASLVVSETGGATLTVNK